MQCLARIYENTYLITHDGNAGVEKYEHLTGPGEQWQHTDCGPRTLEAAAYQIFSIQPPAGAEGEVTVPVASTSTSPGATGDGGFDLPSNGFLVLLAPVVAVTAWKVIRRLGERKPRNAEQLEKWRRKVILAEGVDERVSFTDAQKRQAVKRAGGRCEYVYRDGRRCEVVHGVNGVRLHGDHMFPRSKGGKTEPGNLAALCGPCNQRKGNKELPDEWYLAVFANRTLKQKAVGTGTVITIREAKNRNRELDWEAA